MVQTAGSVGTVVLNSSQCTHAQHMIDPTCRTMLVMKSHHLVISMRHCVGLLLHVCLFEPSENRQRCLGHRTSLRREPPMRPHRPRLAHRPRHHESRRAWNSSDECQAGLGLAYIAVQKQLEMFNNIRYFREALITVLELKAKTASSER
jgi:hypothetical protein